MDILGNLWINSTSKEMLDLLINESKDLYMKDNYKLSSAVQKYNVDTKRF